MKHLFPALFLVLLFASCSQNSESASNGESIAEGLHPLTINGATIHVELALTKDEQSKGLMYRESLPPDHGMLFIFTDAKQRSFWMKNVSFPISLAYIKPDGTIASIHAMKPLDRNAVYSPSYYIQFVLEAPPAWFSKNEIAPGDTIDIQQIKQMLIDSGNDPDAFNVPLETN